MRLLYSDILPLKTDNSQKAFIDYFREAVSNADRLDIAVGYASKESLKELQRITVNSRIGEVCLLIGMYYIEGMPEGIYHAAMALDEAWKKAGIGEVRLVKVFKYHGKLYSFFRNGRPFAGIVGSHNLGAVKPEASNLRQYEVSAVTENSEETEEISELISKLKQPNCSANIHDITDLQVIREVNTSLKGIETVSQVTESETDIYQKHKTGLSFTLPIKVPFFGERHMDDGKHYTKSNLNVCYAAPRNAHKARDWYETQLTVSKQITQLNGYPAKNVPFYAVTDDGYKFKAHTTSDGNKQFSAVGDELILGRWIKGRLAAAGLVDPVNNTQDDRDRAGMITKEMLAAYGCDTLVLTKTDKKMEDENGDLLDVWILSFEAESAGEDK